MHRGSLAASRRSRMERSLATRLFAEVETLLARRCDSLPVLICNIGYSRASVSRPLQLTSQNDQLKLERRILCFKPVLRLEWRGHAPPCVQYSNVFQQTCSRLAPFHLFCRVQRPQGLSPVPPAWEVCLPPPPPEYRRWVWRVSWDRGGACNGPL